MQIYWNLANLCKFLCKFFGKKNIYANFYANFLKNIMQIFYANFLKNIMQIFYANFLCKFFMQIVLTVFWGGGKNTRQMLFELIFYYPILVLYINLYLTYLSN